MWAKPEEKVRACRLLMTVPQDQKTPFFAIFAFPLRSLRLKALVFERKYEKLVTAKFAKNGRQGRKERLSTLGDLDPLGCHDLRNPRGRRRVAVMWAKPEEKVRTCRLLTPVLQVTEDAFLCDLRVPFAIFAVKGSCFSEQIRKACNRKFAKNGHQGRKERLCTSGDLDPIRMSRSQEPAWPAACCGNVGKA
jgi:hypothetical protein